MTSSGPPRSSTGWPASGRTPSRAPLLRLSDTDHEEEEPMPQRHPHDSVDRPWPGCADPKSPRFVPIDLRDPVTELLDDPDLVNKIRTDVLVSHGPGASRTINGEMHVLGDVRKPGPDFDTAVDWALTDEAARRVAVQR